MLPLIPSASALADAPPGTVTKRYCLQVALGNCSSRVCHADPPPSASSVRDEERSRVQVVVRVRPLAGASSRVGTQGLSPICQSTPAR
jgi:hypothetical protein